MERTVEDVKPALKTNLEGLKNVLEELLKQYKKQQDEMEKWKVSELDAQQYPIAFYDPTTHRFARIQAYRDYVM